MIVQQNYWTLCYYSSSLILSSSTLGDCSRSQGNSLFSFGQQRTSICSLGSAIVVPLQLVQETLVIFHPFSSMVLILCSICMITLNNLNYKSIKLHRFVVIFQAIAFLPDGFLTFVISQQLDLICYPLYFPFLISKSLQMSGSITYLEEIKQVYFLLDQSMQASEVKMKSQQKIYNDLYRIFTKNTSKLTALANSISEEIVNSGSQEQLINQYFQILSNSLLKLADSSKRVALRFKSEVLDPLKTFNQNSQNIFEDIKKKIDDRIQSVVTHDQQHSRCKDAYLQAFEKFERHRENQKKIMEKIEKGNKAELEKFNLNTKKLTENISLSEKNYVDSVELVNNDWENVRKDFSLHYQSIIYNEDTKLTFLKKTVTNSIKVFEEIGKGLDTDALHKIEQASTCGKYKNQNPGFSQLKGLLDDIIRSDFKEQFISYEETMRNKKKAFEEESHLTQIFSQLTERQKKLISDLVSPWFPRVNKKFNEPITPIKTTTQKKIGSNEKQATKENDEIDECKERIISEMPSSYYFIQLLYQRITEMTSFYCKVHEDTFLYILNAFTVIIKNIDQNNELGIEFIYKMMVVSQRILLKKAQSSQQKQNQQIQLLSHKFGKTATKFRETKLLSRLLNFLEKRKSKKKSGVETKGALNIAKGFLAALTGKNPALTEEQLYNCLEELVKTLAHFSVPNEIVLPFIKEALGSSHQKSYQYLKGIILHKKDVQDRESLFYKKEIKEKKEELFKKAVETKRTAEYAIEIIAQHGFFGKEQLGYRAISKKLKNIHLHILTRLNLATEVKWIRLIPVDRTMDYIGMKQQVAEQSVPSAVEQIITLDVNRSLHLHGQTLNPTVLHSLLRIYAHFHKEISYCQGMNYLAGYIYIKTLNEEYTYRIFQYLMEVRFKEIFVNEFEVLKVKMYQFERLLAIFHPDISEHFKRQSVSPQCYIVSWIITLFASSYQYTLSSFIIDFLWERFIIWGWPEFFRFVLWLFSVFKEELVELSYDRALHFLGELSRSEMFLSDTQKFKSKYSAIENPAIGIERYPVSQDLLNKFAQQYELDKH